MFVTQKRSCLLGFAMLQSSTAIAAERGCQQKLNIRSLSGAGSYRMRKLTFMAAALILAPLGSIVSGQRAVAAPAIAVPAEAGAQQNLLTKVQWHHNGPGWHRGRRGGWRGGPGWRPGYRWRPGWGWAPWPVVPGPYHYGSGPYYEEPAPYPPRPCCDEPRPYYAPGPSEPEPYEPPLK